MRSVTDGPATLAPSGQAVEDGAGLEREPDLHGVGQGRGPPRWRPVGPPLVEAPSWCSRPSGVHGRDAEDVPVDGAVGQQRQRRHEIDLLVTEPVEAAGHDELERGAGCADTHAAQRLDLAAGRRRARVRARRHRRCGSGPATWRTRAPLRRASPAEHRAMARTWPSVATGTHGVVAPSPRAAGRVADEEAGVHRRPRPPTGRPTRRTSSTTSPDLQRGDGHALHPRHHRAPGTGRAPGPAGANENPQLPPITVVTPCSGEGLAVGVPRRVGRRSGCGGRRSPGPRAARRPR